MEVEAVLWNTSRLDVVLVNEGTDIKRVLRKHTLGIVRQNHLCPCLLNLPPRLCHEQVRLDYSLSS